MKNSNIKPPKSITLLIKYVKNTLKPQIPKIPYWGSLLIGAGQLDIPDRQGSFRQAGFFQTGRVLPDRQGFSRYLGFFQDT